MAVRPRYLYKKGSRVRVRAIYVRTCARGTPLPPPSLMGQAFCIKQNGCRLMSERKGGGKPGFSAS
nr:MAG TPA: hypothetical protein [Microviridae sp.]